MNSKAQQLKFVNLYSFTEPKKAREAVKPGLKRRWDPNPTLTRAIRKRIEITGKNDPKRSIDSSTLRLNSLARNMIKAHSPIDVSEAWRLGNSVMKEHWNSVQELIIKERTSRRVKGRLGDKSPWMYIANVADLKISLGTFEPSLNRRVGTKMESIPYRNKGLNQYLGHIVKTLEKHRDKPSYWKLAELMLRKSMVFRLASINHVFPTWYKDMKWSDLQFLITTLEGALLTAGPPMDTTRFYVEKANGKLRPIGAPDPLWRIVLNMTNSFLVWFMEPIHQECQHAYRPGRGTGTAWRSLIQNNVLRKPYVYEYDLKGFFDNVKVEPILEFLQSKGMPKEWSNAFQTWHSKMPKPAPWLNEDMKREYIREMTHRNQKNWDSQIETTEDTPKPWLTGKLHKISFAQGSPMAPTLSIIGKHLWLQEMKELNPNSTWVVYADDGIIGSEVPINLLDNEKLGIFISPEKSKYVKNEGQWKDNLQFLGLHYDWNSGDLSIKTRSGINEKPSKEELSTILTLRKNMMPKLVANGQVEFTPVERRHLTVKPPLPWKSYYLHKNLIREDGSGGFGNMDPDAWKWDKTGRVSGYFEWLPETRPESYSGEIELNQLAQTKLWDWYYSRGFNLNRKEPNRVLEWTKSSLAESVIRQRRRKEPDIKNLINIGSICNWRLIKMLKREKTRRYSDDQPFKVARGIATAWDPEGSIFEKPWLPKAETYKSEESLWTELKIKAKYGG
jgi:hypothetical protein